MPVFAALALAQPALIGRFRRLETPETGSPSVNLAGCRPGSRRSRQCRCLFCLHQYETDHLINTVLQPSMPKLPLNLMTEGQVRCSAARQRAVRLQWRALPHTVPHTNTPHFHNSYHPPSLRPSPPHTFIHPPSPPFPLSPALHPSCPTSAPYICRTSLFPPCVQNLALLPHALLPPCLPLTNSTPKDRRVSPSSPQEWAHNSGSAHPSLFKSTEEPSHRMSKR